MRRGKSIAYGRSIFILRGIAMWPSHASLNHFPDPWQASEKKYPIHAPSEGGMNGVSSRPIHGVPERPMNGVLR